MTIIKYREVKAAELQPSDLGHIVSFEINGAKAFGFLTVVTVGSNNQVGLYLQGVVGASIVTAATWVTVYREIDEKVDTEVSVPAEKMTGIMENGPKPTAKVASK